MDSYTQSELFFFISSVSFVFLWLLVALLLFYLIKVASTLSRITEKFEKNIDNIGDATKELLNDMRDNVIFKFFFGKKRKNKS